MPHVARASSAKKTMPPATGSTARPSGEVGWYQRRTVHSLLALPGFTNAGVRA
jgi:hypothetical protein